MPTTGMTSTRGKGRLVGSLPAMAKPGEGPAPREAGPAAPYRSICLPLDGSPAAERVLPLARTLAGRLAARLCLVHVHQAGGDRAYTGRAQYAWRENEQRCQESRYLWSKVEGGEREPATTAVLVSGRVPDALLRFVREQGTDLLIMTTHGAGGAGRPWLGSVADRVLRSSRVPVLLAPAGGEAVELARPAAFRRVLVPLDGSGAAEQVLQHAVALGRLSDAAYLLVQVDMPPGQSGGEEGVFPAEGLRVAQAAQHYLDFVAACMRERGLAVETRVLVGARPAEAILTCAAELGVDLIALTLHGESGKQRRLFGSVADKLIRAAADPLLLFRPCAGRIVPRVV